MRKIIAIAWKDALINFASPSSLLFFFVLPVVFTFIIGGGFGGATASQDTRAKLLVVDQAGTASSQQLIDLLGQSTALSIEPMPWAEANATFDADDAPALLIIPAGFNSTAMISGTAQLQLKQQPNNLDAVLIERTLNTTASQITSAIAAAQTAVAEAERIRPFTSPAERQAYFDAALKHTTQLLAQAPSRLNVTKPSQIAPDFNPAAQASAGQLITWVFIPLLGISAMFAYERRNGTLRRVLTTPASRAQLLLGTIFGQFVTALVQMGLLIGFGAVVMRLNWGQSPLALIVLLSSFALAGVSLGTMLGTFVRSEGQANGLSILLGQVMALLGGCWYPLELFPAPVRTVVQVLPTTWAMQGLSNVLQLGAELPAVLPNIAVLLGFAAVFFVIGVARFRFE